MAYRALEIAIALPLRPWRAVRWKIYRFVLLWWAIPLKTQRMFTVKYWTAGAGCRLTYAVRFMAKQKNIGILA